MTEDQIKFLGAVIGSFIAAISTLAVMFFTLRHQARLEEERRRTAQDDDRKKWERAQDDDRKKWERAQDDDRKKWERAQDDAHSKAVRDAVTALGKTLASAVHSVCWLTWDVEKHPGHATQGRVEAYDVEAHRLLAELVMGEATLASLDVGRYERLRPALERYFTLDRRVGDAGKLLGSSPEEAKSQFVACFHDAAALAKELPALLAGVFREGVSAPAEPGQVRVAPEAAAPAEPGQVRVALEATASPPTDDDGRDFATTDVAPSARARS